MASLVEMRGIVRCFGAVRANDGVDLDVEAGEIVGLLGENGSGKSTLMKVLFGMIAPDSGTIVFRGRSLSGHRPAAAMAAGAAMIHQHFMLIEAMTVVENVMLGWSPADGFSSGPRSRRAFARRAGGLVSISIPTWSSGKCRSVVASASKSSKRSCAMRNC
jgi:ABC-type uncharacterized transport system ATPase subunit